MNRLASVIRIREAIEDGDLEYAAGLARDLEHDLAPRRRRHRCPVCALPFEWPGLVQRHVAIVHPEHVS